MKKLLIAALLTTVAAPAFAEPSCDVGAFVTPVWEAIQSFEAEGGQVIKFKINGGGCYEIYGLLNGAKLEVFFDPITGEELDRIAA